jgi:hypothetical protein
MVNERLRIVATGSPTTPLRLTARHPFAHETLRTTPSIALGVADRVWTNGDLPNATLAIERNRKRNLALPLQEQHEINRVAFAVCIHRGFFRNRAQLIYFVLVWIV